MTHRRTEVRELLVSTLKNKTEAGKNVFDWRVFPIQECDLFPNINVITNEEIYEEVSSNQELIKRSLQCVIVISDFFDSHKTHKKIENISNCVEYLIHKINHNDFLFKLVKTEFYFETSTSKAISVCQMTLECTYYTESDKDIIYPDFLRELEVELQIGNIEHNG